MEYTIKEVQPGMEIPAEMLDLYKDAFPPEERRPWDTPEDVRLFMDGHPRMHMKIMETDNRFVGFLIYWHLTDNVIYGEHLATLPHRSRCKIYRRLRAYGPRHGIGTGSRAAGGRTYPSAYWFLPTLRPGIAYGHPLYPAPLRSRSGFHRT